LLTALFCASVATPAFAEPAFSWTGVYVGANLGRASGNSDRASLFTCPNPGACAYGELRDLELISAFGTGSFSDHEFTGGVQVGHNWQVGKIVFGVEGEVGALKLRHSRTVRRAPFGEAANNYWITTGFEASWAMTLRGRLGVTVIPTVLLYGTGGLSGTRLTVSNRFVDDASTILGITVNTVGGSSASQNKWGWTAGVGAEWAVAGNWILKAEYLHLDFGSVGTAARVVNTDIAPDDPNILMTVADLRVRITRIGFNYRF
jgi:outer membrane immunogenic protein